MEGGADQNINAEDGRAKGSGGGADAADSAVGVDGGSDAAADPDEGSDEGSDDDDEDDDDDESSVIDEDDVPKLTVEILTAIQLNVPAVTSVLVDDFSGMNGLYVGRCIAQNVHLRDLIVYGDRIEDGDNDGFHAMMSFLDGCGYNRSIRKFHLVTCGVTPSLWSFIIMNANLTSIRLDFCGIVQSESEILAASLWNRSNKGSLRTFSMMGNDVYDADVANVLRHMRGYHNLVELCLAANEIGEAISRELGSMLSDPGCRLRTIDVSNCSIENTGIASLCAGMARNGTLRSLDLSENPSSTPPGWRALFASLEQTSSSITKLDVGSNSISDEGAAALGSFLSSGTALRTLYMYHNEHTFEFHAYAPITQRGWCSIFGGLKRATEFTRLRTLSVEGQSLGAAGLAALASVLETNASITSVSLGHCHRGSGDDWSSFFRCLASPTSVLGELKVGDNGIADDAVAELVRSLAENVSLSSIDLAENPITGESWARFRRLLCDGSSVASVLGSNHTLVCLSHEALEDISLTDIQLLEVYLTMNQGENKAYVKRHKIIFASEKNDDAPSEFSAMDVGVLPQALSWIGLQEDGVSLHYKVIRSLPCLFGFANNDAARGAKKRRLE